MQIMSQSFRSISPVRFGNIEGNIEKKDSQDPKEQQEQEKERTAIGASQIVGLGTISGGAVGGLAAAGQVKNDRREQNQSAQEPYNLPETLTLAKGIGAGAGIGMGIFMIGVLGCVAAYKGVRKLLG